MRHLALIMLAGLLAGCVNQLAIRQARLAQLVGHSEGELVQQMGVPNRTYETEGVKYLAYDDSRTQVLSPPPAYPYGPGILVMVRRWLAAPGREHSVRDDLYHRAGHGAFIYAARQRLRLRVLCCIFATIGRINGLGAAR